MESGRYNSTSIAFERSDAKFCPRHRCLFGPIFRRGTLGKFRPFREPPNETQSFDTKNHRFASYRTFSSSLFHATTTMGSFRRVVFRFPRGPRETPRSFSEVGTVSLNRVLIPSDRERYSELSNNFLFFFFFIATGPLFEYRFWLVITRIMRK